MDIPRNLIYEERTKLEEFGIEEESNVNKMLYDQWLLGREDLHALEDGYISRKLKVFNDAHYVCTLITMQRQCNDFLPYFVKRISMPSIVIPLVHFYVSKLSHQSQGYTRLLKTIDTEARVRWQNNYDDILEIEEKYNGVIDSKMFTPRKLTPFLLSDIMWYKVTEGYKQENILKLLYFVGRDSSDNWCMVIDAIKNAAKEYEWENNNNLGYYEEELEDGRWYMVEEKPIDLSDLYLFLDNLKGRFDEFTLRNNTETQMLNHSLQSSTNPTEAITESNDDFDYDDAYDSVFVAKLKCKAIYKALQDFTSDKFDKKGKPFWYVVYRVFVFIKWIPSGNNGPDLLRWVNFHFHCGWKDFKFRKIDKQIRSLEPYQWDKNTMRTEKGEDYRRLAVRIKNVFTQTVINGNLCDEEDFNSGTLKDRIEFIKEGKTPINNG